MKKNIGIIGFGNMGSAIVERIKTKYKVIVYDKDKNKTKNLCGGIEVAENILDLVNRAENVVLAVKPQDFKNILGEIKANTKEKLFISIAAGITTGNIEECLGKVRVIRVMPNLPARIGKGMSCLCKGRFATQKDLVFAIKLFSCLGKTLVLKENMMNAVTVISGSGPGFLCDFLESKPQKEWKEFSNNVFIPEFILAAESLGFNKKEAKLLVSTTTSGSLTIVQTWDLTPSQLKKQIASKGGTTESGLEILHRGGTLREAVEAAVKRAEELSKKE